VIVPDDPLADVADAWEAMWDLPAGPDAPAEFERRAAEALAAWRDKQFDLPDYYLVVVPAQQAGVGPDFYLGPLRAIRPRRVAVTVTADTTARPDHIIGTLRSLKHRPWWPPLDELINASRGFYPASIPPSQG